MVLEALSYLLKRFQAASSCAAIPPGEVHLAVVKHLVSEIYVERLLVRPDLIQGSQQFHFRPFNGHHCQVPVTRGDGSLTQEINDWFPIVRATCGPDMILAGDQNAYRYLEPVLEKLTAARHFVGKPGSAAALKALVNMVMNINTAGLTEGLGLELDRLPALERLGGFIGQQLGFQPVLQRGARRDTFGDRSDESVQGEGIALLP